ncbi:Ldh family oxidoreductase [Rhodobacteraceae bacterium N5(2021)]|uniref:Ldh family oxidoreductase n=1 Tax=Gymnodinialimonas phycosphaerae TaxID=2841589 RepID=A0A975TS37_9RHOB|nr:Ldh family oxidoreductase [Gymnodinialimonas phycosphaerae]MBY4893479.1 Ldh family oxidoreductase [Gymnodinialimonas phycosphaerae]
MKDSYDLSDLDMLARDCLTRAGVGEATAQIVARDVALSEAAGHADSGFTALLRDIRLIRYGRLLPDAEVTITTPAPSVFCVDAGHGFAASAVSQALPAAILAAQTQGMVMVHLTRASDPGTLAGAMVEIAGANLAAVSLRTHGKGFAIRPMRRQVIALDAGAQTMLDALLAVAPPAADSPMGDPVAESIWLTVLDPRVTAAEELLAHLPEMTATPSAQGIALAPELLVQIVNA